MYLNCHSHYSLRYGTISVEQLVLQAKSMGIKKLVLTDINNSTGILEFVKHCIAQSIDAVVGMDFRNENKLLYVGIARNNNGYKELNDWLTLHNLQHLPVNDTPPEFTNVFVIYPYSDFKNGKIKLNQLRENEFIGIHIKDLSKVQLDKKEEQKKYVLMQSVTFLSEKDYALHCRLRAVDNNILLSQITSEQIAGADEFFIPEKTIYKALEHFPEIKNNTEYILNRQESAEIVKIKNPIQKWREGKLFAPQSTLFIAVWSIDYSVIIYY